MKHSKADVTFQHGFTFSNFGEVCAFAKVHCTDQVSNVMICVHVCKSSSFVDTSSAVGFPHKNTSLKAAKRSKAEQGFSTYIECYVEALAGPGYLKCPYSGFTEH